MKCIYCGCEESKVVDSRSAEDGLAIRRRRECVQCGKRFTTYERLEETSIIVVKKDGRREAFNTQKILFGVEKSCDKLPVTRQQMDEMIARVMQEIIQMAQKEVTTDAIGELVMRALRDLNQVAYVRFAAVYRSFQDVNSFLEELKALQGEEEA